MSSTYPSLTYPIKPENLPDDKDPRALVDIIEATESHGVLEGGSRLGWFGGVMQEISTILNIPSLTFLKPGPWDRDNGIMFATVLDSKQVSQAIQAIEDIFQWVRTQPEKLLEIDDQGYSPEDIPSFLDEATVSLSPGVDDADSFNYLFDYLKSLQHLLKGAEQNGEFVIYVQFDGG